jgi:hypothetical protein
MKRSPLTSKLGNLFKWLAVQLWMELDLHLFLELMGMQQV